MMALSVVRYHRGRIVMPVSPQMNVLHVCSFLRGVWRNQSCGSGSRGRIASSSATVGACVTSTYCSVSPTDGVAIELPGAGFSHRIFDSHFGAVSWDAFPTYVGISGPDLPTPGQSSDAPGYIPMTSPVTHQRTEGSLSLLGLGTPMLGEQGSLDSLRHFDPG